MNAREAKTLLRERLRRGCTIRVRGADHAKDTHRGYEIRIHARDDDDEERLREALKALGIQPGAAYAKGSGRVIPCYGKAGVENLLRLVGGERSELATERMNWPRSRRTPG